MRPATFNVNSTNTPKIFPLNVHAISAITSVQVTPTNSANYTVLGTLQNINEYSAPLTQCNWFPVSSVFNGATTQQQDTLTDAIYALQFVINGTVTTQNLLVTVTQQGLK